MYAYGPDSLMQCPAAEAPAVGLVNTYSTRNLGDAAIMAALARLVPAGAVHAQIAEQNACHIPGVALVSDLEACDAFISVGGDIFNNARPAFVTRNFVQNAMQLYRKRHRAIVFGQTVPSSCRGVALSLLAETLRRTRSVTVRDSESHVLLKRYGVTARLSYDAAFVLRPDLADIVAAEAMFERTRLDPDRTALLSVRGFDGMYRQSPDASVAKLTELARLLIQRGHQVGILMQSDVGAADSDRFVAHRIMSHVPAARPINLFADHAAPSRLGLLMGAMSIANIAVGLRYHTSVLRLASGRQPYNLPYSRKGRDLGQRLGLTGCSLERFEPAAEIAAIEATAGQTFDARPVAQDVSDAFAQGYEALQ